MWWWGGNRRAQERPEAEDKLCTSQGYIKDNIHKKQHFTVEETDSAFEIVLKLRKRAYSKVRVTTHFSPKTVWFAIYMMTLKIIGLVLKHEANRSGNI